MKLYEKLGLGLGIAVMSGAASATTAFADITAGVDFAEVKTWVGASGLVIVGIALAFKAIKLAKRGIGAV